jgi:site-specific recombinase XerC
MAHQTTPGWSSVFVLPSTGARRRIQRRARDEGVVAATGPSVNEIVDEFLEALDNGSARDRYGRRFSREAASELRWCLSGHVAEALGAMSLDDVRRRDVEALVFALGDAGLSDGRLRTIAKCVRSLYDYAIERGLARHNPAERIAFPDAADTEQRTASSAIRLDPALARAVSDHAISLMLRVATLGFVITALVLLAESL